LPFGDWQWVAYFRNSHFQSKLAIMATAQAKGATPKKDKKAYPKETYMFWFESMLLMRKFEEKAGQLYGMQKIRGFCHLYIGQEACAACAVSALKRGDKYITAYRDHAHPLALGTSPNAIMAELYGKETGVSKGKGGSMHIFDKGNNFFGGHGIVGAQVPLGAGIGFAEKYNKTIAQIALNWLIAHPVVIAIPTANRKYIKENAGAADFEISKEDFNKISDLYNAKPSYIQVDKIEVSAEGQSNRRVYKTIEQAIENKLNFVPSPNDLAQYFKNNLNEEIKPVRLIKGEGDKYQLVEGRVRYWAWVIAHNGEKPITAYIRKKL